ncbi:MAG: hypothetical protein KC502_00090 [Myxococcales bacterium]|nr:hypothetical protein [Myxococcales bacterium]
MREKMQGWRTYLVGLTLLAGCTATTAQDNGAPGPDGEVIDGAAIDGDSGRSVANCGKKVGQLLCDVQLLGYGHPEGANTPFEVELALSDLVKQAPRPHALVLIGGAWCPSCKLATQMAVKQFGEIDGHVTVINVLVEGDTPKLPARKSHLDSWKKALHPPFAMVADAFATPMVARERLGVREAAVLVDRQTGTILARATSLAKLWPDLKKWAPKR